MGKTTKSTKIRIDIEDAKKWRDYCEATRMPSADLFKKVMKSPKLDIEKRILEEAQKREMELKRKLGIK